MDDDDPWPKREPTNPVDLTQRWDRLFNASVIVVCGWAVVEAPLELGDSIDLSCLLALVASKVLIGLIGIAAIANLRYARHVFTFICGVGVFAVAPALPLEYARCVALALFSTVDCLGKAACVTSFVFASLAADATNAHRAFDQRPSTFLKTEPTRSDRRN
jgi:hypothetical protein